MQVGLSAATPACNLPCNGCYCLCISLPCSMCALASAYELLKTESHVFSMQALSWIVFMCSIQPRQAARANCACTRLCCQGLL